MPKQTKSRSKKTTAVRTSKQTSSFSLSKRTMMVIAVASVAVIGGVLALIHSHANSCATDDKLVNNCRAWFGATVGGYPQVGSDNASQYAYGEKRLNNTAVLTNATASTTVNRKYDLVHRYHAPTQTTFDDNEKLYYGRDNTYLFVNWKPDTTWANATGSNATVNTRIDAMADNIKALGSKKIFLTVFHEPENDVSTGNCTTNASSASAGSPADYVNMWHNVRARFDAKGVNNVVWTMNYIGYPTWNCLVPMLWPGNSYVDWVAYDPYGGGTHTATLFHDSVDPFYTYLTQNSDATHNYLSKPWALAEHGAWGNSGTTQAGAVDYWKQAASAVTNHLYPNLKMYMTFDTNVNGTSQVGMDFSGKPAPDEQAAYNAFAAAVQDTIVQPTPEPTPTPTPTPTPPPAPTPAPTPTPDKTAPTIKVTSPANNSTVKGTITVKATASDNVKVTAVTMRVDEKWVATDNVSPWSFSLNTKNYKKGKHAVILRAWDNAGNYKDAATLTLNIKN